jgi:transposase
MLTNLFFPGVAGVRVERTWREGPALHLAIAGTRRWARCPLCQRRSKRRHSTYERTVADLPCAGAGVVLHLHVRRFVCRVRWCRRKIFAERWPDLVVP